MLTKNIPSQSRNARFEVFPVTGRREMGAFIRVPRLLYKGLEGFDPPLDEERRKLIAPPEAPFLKSGRAAYWMVRREGRIAGRISAQAPFMPALDTNTSAPIGYFGCLDAIDDAETVSLLIDTAANWLRGEGFGLMQGPFTMSINGETGLLVEGQEKGGMILLPWHPAYLADKVEMAGLQAAQDVVSYTYAVKSKTPFLEWAIQLEPEKAMPGLRARALDRGNLARDIGIVREIYNEAWAGNWGFLPVSSDEAVALERAMRDLLVSDSGVIVERDGVPVAAALFLPNLYEVIEGFNGRLLPFNWIKLLYSLAGSRFKSGRILLFGVLPSESGKPYGSLLPALMLREFYKRSKKYGFEKIDLGWILDHRTEITRILDRAGAEITRRHRIYQRLL